jgi:hypothetical protein
MTALLPLLLLLLFSHVVDALGATAATTFYVSSSNPAASDANPGTDPSAPWRTLARAAQVAPGLVGGSQILLRTGDVFDINSVWYMRGLNGTLANPVVLSSFDDRGSGVRVAERPLIRRNASIPAPGPTITIDASQGVSVRGLEIAGGEMGVVFTVHAGAGAGEGTHAAEVYYDGFEVRDCFFRGIRGLAVNTSTATWWGHAIALAADAPTGVNLTSVRIANNIVNDSDAFYDNRLLIPGWNHVWVDGLDMVGNALTRVSFNSVFLDYSSRVVLANNTFSRDAPAFLFQLGTTDLIIQDMDASSSIVGNEIGWRGEFEPGGPDGCAVDFETRAVGFALTQNYIHDAYGSGIMVLGHETTSSGLVIEGNVLLRNGCNQTRDDRGGMAFLHGNSSGSIAGNVFTTCPGVPFFYSPIPGALDGWTMEGNVLDGVNGTVVVLPSPDVVGGYDAASDTLVINASCPSCAAQGAVLRFTVDGSKPTAWDPLVPASGTIVLPARATAVFVKAFPSSPSGRREGSLLAIVDVRGPGGVTTTTVVEGPAVGDVFAPPER